MAHPLRLVGIAGCSNHDHGHHSHAVVGLAADAIDAGFVEAHGGVLAHFAGNRRRAVRQHSINRFCVVSFVGGHEFHAVSRLDLDERGLEHHDARSALVQQLDLHLGGRGSTAERGRGGDEEKDCRTHGDLQSIARLTSREVEAVIGESSPVLFVRAQTGN